MTEHNRLAPDANTLLRAAFGVRVRALLETYEVSVSFYTPDICFSDVSKIYSDNYCARQLNPGVPARRVMSRDNCGDHEYLVPRLDLWAYPVTPLI